MRQYKPRIDTAIEKFLNEQIKETTMKEFYSMIKDYASQGKRLRPLSLILGHEIFSGFDKKLLMSCVSVELHHTYSLILDDFMDEDSLRRNEPTLHETLRKYYEEKFSPADSKLFKSGSVRFAVSFATMLANITNILSKKAIMSASIPQSQKYEIIRLSERTDEMIYRGQMLDLLLENKDVSEEEYMEMIRLKTGMLFGMCFEIGALIAGRDENIRHTLREFGINSAMAFQIQDDLLDITAAKGHKLGSDIRRGKKTLLYIKAKEFSNESQKKILEKVYGRDDETAVKKVIHIMKDTQADKYCKKVIMHKNKQSRRHSSKIPNKALLYEFLDYMLSSSS